MSDNNTAIMEPAIEIQKTRKARVRREIPDHLVSLKNSVSSVLRSERALAFAINRYAKLVKQNEEIIAGLKHKCAEAYLHLRDVSAYGASAHLSRPQ